MIDWYCLDTRPVSDVWLGWWWTHWKSYLRNVMIQINKSPLKRQGNFLQRNQQWQKCWWLTVRRDLNVHSAKLNKIGILSRLYALRPARIITNCGTTSSSLMSRVLSARKEKPARTHPEYENVSRMVLMRCDLFNQSSTCVRITEWNRVALYIVVTTDPNGNGIVCIYTLWDVVFGEVSQVYVARIMR